MAQQITKEILEKLGIYLLNGLSESDACILADISESDLLKLKSKNEKVNNFIEKMKVRFKYNHIKEIQGEKNPKTSQWMLEKLVPEFSGSRARGQEQPTINIINALVREIQGDTTDGIAQYTIKARERTDVSENRLSVSEVLE